MVINHAKNKINKINELCFTRKQKMIYFLAGYLQTPQQPFFLHFLMDYALQHSSFERGYPVLFAGYWQTDDNGKITFIQSHSGHYQPTVDSLKSFVHYLQSHRCNLDGVLCEQVTRIKPGATEDCLKRDRYTVAELQDRFVDDFHRDVLPPGSLPRLK